MGLPPRRARSRTRELQPPNRPGRLMDPQQAPARMTPNPQQRRALATLPPHQAQAQMTLSPNLLPTPRATNGLSSFSQADLSPSSCSRSSSSAFSIVEVAVTPATGQPPRMTTPRARRISLDDTARNEDGVRDRTGDARKSPIRTRPRRDLQTEHGVAVWQLQYNTETYPHCMTRTRKERISGSAAKQLARKSKEAVPRSATLC